MGELENQSLQENAPVEPSQPGPDPGGSRRSAVVILVVVLVVTGMLIAGRHLARKNGGATAGIPAGNNIKGVAAPDFELTTLDGAKVRLSDLRGKAVVLNFWATWCGPCKIEIPWLEDLQKQYAPQGLQIVGVSMDDDGPAKVKQFAQQEGINYTVVMGNDKVADLYGGVDGLPETFYIGRDGKIVTRVLGLVGHKEIEQNIQSALQQGANTAGGE